MTEGRIRAAAEGASSLPADTITGSLAVHTVDHDGKPMILVSWQQAVRISPEQWATIAADLGLTTAAPPEPGA